jgi:hypothetical protein
MNIFPDQREDFSFSMSKQVVQSSTIVPQEVKRKLAFRDRTREKNDLVTELRFSGDIKVQNIIKSLQRKP